MYIEAALQEERIRSLPAPKCFVNKLNTNPVMVIENLKKLAQTCQADRGMCLWIPSVSSKCT